MATRQDRSHPTGVVDERAGQKGDRGQVARERNRKADAALSMSLSGANWGEIAEALGYPTPRAARLAVEKSLVRQLSTDDDKVKMRAMAGARLDRLLRGIWMKAINPEDPEQMAAVGKSRELIADHNKLFGLNAPTELTVHSPTASELEDWVLRMTATMVPDVEEPDIYEAEVIVAEVEAS